ncbi:hypothetical protein BH09ACT12_BH09ACT12_11510 [soil metagenome]
MNDHLNEQPEGRDGRRASDLFHGATTDFAPDVDRLVQGGVARGRTLRRRRRVGTSLAAVAVVGVLGIAAGAGSQLFDGDASPPPEQYADSTSADETPTPSPPTAPTVPPFDASSLPPGATTTQPIDASIAVSALDVSAIVGELVPGGSAGDTLLDPATYVDEPEEIGASFLFDGTITSFGIEPADTLATCAELIDPADQADGEPGGECVDQDGIILLRWGPQTADGVTSQGVWAFVHGYVVSAGSTNAAEGKDADPVMADPALSMDDLTRIVTSERWFESES